MFHIWLSYSYIKHILYLLLYQSLDAIYISCYFICMVKKMITINEENLRAIELFLEEDGLTFSGFVRREMVKYLKEKERASVLRDATDGRR